MNWNKIKIYPGDAQFSKYLRRIARGYCARCGRIKIIYRSDGSQRPPWLSLQAMHFHVRGKNSVRYDLQNVWAGCPKCHKWLDEHKTEFRIWVLGKLGRKRFDALEIRANTRSKAPLSQLDIEAKIVYTILNKELDKRGAD